MAAHRQENAFHARYAANFLSVIGEIQASGGTTLRGVARAPAARVTPPHQQTDISAGRQ
jgi:hypothetical protein